MIFNASKAGKLFPKDWKKNVQSAMLHAISLAATAYTHAQGWAANCMNPEVRRQAEKDEFEREIALLREEMRIKDIRMTSIPPRERPQYGTKERMAILELRSARGWSIAETARRFQVLPETISSWMKRLDEQGKEEFLKLSEPVNKYPEFVTSLVQKLKRLCPSMGGKRMAQTLALAGLHLGDTTVRRMLKKPLPPPQDSDQPSPNKKSKRLVGAAKYPHHIWQMDLTVVPTRLGFWVPWFPFSQFQRWPFCWWVAVVTDVFTRQIIGTQVFATQPTSPQVQSLFGKLILKFGCKPHHIITDKGPQFWCDDFKEWCRELKIKPRFGAIGQHNSIARVERLILSVKSEFIWRIPIPLQKGRMLRLLRIYAEWFNEHRPHQGLGGSTPSDMEERLPPVCHRSRYEPRKAYPISTNIKLKVEPMGIVRNPAVAVYEPGQKLDLEVKFFQNYRELPIIQLKEAA